MVRTLIAGAFVGMLASGCRTRLDASAPQAQLEAAVERALGRAGVMPGRVVSHSIAAGRFSIIYETDDEHLRYRVTGVLDDGGPVVESVCEIGGRRCLDLGDDVLWDEGPAPVSA